MYGGLARAMQINDANALRLFGVKNELDQQRQAQTQRDRQNAIQDKALAQAEQDRATAAAERSQDRATAAAERTRQHGIEDARLAMVKTEFEQQQEDRKRKLDEWAKLEGFHDVARELQDTGVLGMEGVEKFNSQGSHKLIPRSDAAVVDPQTGIVRLKWQDGTVTERPFSDFLTELGIKGAAPEKDDTGQARVLVDLQEGKLKDVAGLKAEIAPDLKAIEAKSAALEKARGKWFGAREVAQLEKEIADTTAKIKPKIDAINEATARAGEYEKAAANIALRQRRGTTGGGLTRYNRIGDPEASPAAAGGLMGQQAPFYLNEGPGGEPGTDTPPVVTDPQRNLAMIEQDIKERRAAAEAENKATVEKLDRVKLEQRMQAKPDMSFPKTRKALSRIGGLMGSALVPAALAEQTGREMAVQGSKDVTTFVPELAKAVAENETLRAWNTVSEPALRMTLEQWEEYRQALAEGKAPTDAEGLRKWIAARN